MATAAIKQLGIGALLRAAGEERARSGDEVRLVVAGSGPPLRHVAAALRTGGGVLGVVEGGASSELFGQPVPPGAFDAIRRTVVEQLAAAAAGSRGGSPSLHLRRGDLCLLVADGLSPAEQAAVINEVRDADAQLVVSIPSSAAAEATRRNALQAGAMASELARYSEQLPVERTDLARALAAAAGDRSPALAAAVPALRPAVVRHLIQVAARQNGLVGVVVFVPGADMPVMTLNQVRMVLRIGRAYGFEVEPERVLEILGVIAGAVGLRTVARQTLGFVPLAGWAIKGFFGYAGTLAVGKAAVAYYERGSLGTGEGLRGSIPESVRDKVAERIPDSLQGSLNKVLERFGRSKDGS